MSQIKGQICFTKLIIRGTIFRGRNSSDCNVGMGKFHITIIVSKIIVIINHDER